MDQTETQWPRYQVFVQEKPGAPHLDYGSVHAPDHEMALYNARDVFVRRPECINIWVVPADKIFTKTAEELEVCQPGTDASTSQEDTHETYQVFQKQRSAGTHQLVGQVEAGSPSAAMAAALEKYQDTKPFSWWVFSARMIFKSEVEDVESMFAPAREKKFRMATDFHTHTAMRNLMKDLEG
jgi:ring-1,2-phenylacetyl-CoA epoxidase subunit PaaB